jgi:hypothetical protein
MADTLPDADADTGGFTASSTTAAVVLAVLLAVALGLLIWQASSNYVCRNPVGPLHAPVFPSPGADFSAAQAGKRHDLASHASVLRADNLADVPPGTYWVSGAQDICDGNDGTVRAITLGTNKCVGCAGDVKDPKYAYLSMLPFAYVSSAMTAPGATPAQALTVEAANQMQLDGLSAGTLYGVPKSAACNSATAGSGLAQLSGGQLVCVRAPDVLPAQVHYLVDLAGSGKQLPSASRLLGAGARRSLHSSPLRQETSLHQPQPRTGPVRLADPTHVTLSPTFKNINLTPTASVVTLTGTSASTSRNSQLNALATSQAAAADAASKETVGAKPAAKSAAQSTLLTVTSSTPLTLMY